MCRGAPTATALSLREPGPVWVCVRGGRESLLSLREPGPVWPCVSEVAICVSIVVNQKGSILTRFTTILTQTRADLALRKGGRESLLSLRAENLRSGSFEKKSNEFLA